ncbi:hypothetical protein ACF0H5_008082 [Mactra antiquata]
MKGVGILLQAVFVVILTAFYGTESQDILQTPCDIKARNESCPDNYCCVRDEFLFTETYCRRYGTAGSNCGIKESSFECPCEDGYQCASNINGHITSLFGKCYPILGGSTDEPTTGSLDMRTDGQSLSGTTSMSRKNESTTNLPDGPTKFSDGQIIG